MFARLFSMCRQFVNNSHQNMDYHHYLLAINIQKKVTKIKEKVFSEFLVQSRRYSKEKLPFCFSFKVKDKSEFESRVLHAKIPIIVMFSAIWIDPTTNMLPLLDDEVSNHPGQIMAALVDVDQFGDLAFKYKITDVPSLILFKNGVEVEIHPGFMDRNEIKQLIKRSLENI